MSPRKPVSGTRMVRNLHQLLAVLKADTQQSQIRVLCVSTGMTTTIVTPRTYWLVYQVTPVIGRTRRYSERVFVKSENPLGKTYEATKNRNLTECYQRAQTRVETLRSAFPDLDIGIAFAEQKSEHIRG